MERKGGKGGKGGEETREGRGNNRRGREGRDGKKEVRREDSRELVGGRKGWTVGRYIPLLYPETSKCASPAVFPGVLWCFFNNGD